MPFYFAKVGKITVEGEKQIKIQLNKRVLYTKIKVLKNKREQFTHYPTKNRRIKQKLHENT